MGKLPSGVLRRPTLFSRLPSTPVPSSQTHLPQTQIRHATFVPRPRRPYHFTQLVQQSDGSTFTVRTTMPTALYKSAKDTRNHILWQPSDKSLKNVEVDEAGKLAAFRERFGRGWDIEDAAAQETEAAATAPVGKGAKAVETPKPTAEAAPAPAPAPAAAEAAQEAEADPFDSLVDLISSYAKDDPSLKGGKSAKESAKGGKKKK